MDNVDVDTVGVDDDNVSEMMRRRSRRSYENDFCRWPVGKKPSQELSGKSDNTEIKVEVNHQATRAAADPLNDALDGHRPANVSQPVKPPFCPCAAPTYLEE